MPNEISMRVNFETSMCARAHHAGGRTDAARRLAGRWSADLAIVAGQERKSLGHKHRGLESRKGESRKTNRKGESSVLSLFLPRYSRGE